MTEEFIPVEAMTVLSVQPGDMVALKIADRLTADQRAQVQDYFQRVIGCPIIVLDNGIEIGVLRPVAAESDIDAAG